MGWENWKMKTDEEIKGTKGKITEYEINQEAIDTKIKTLDEIEKEEFKDKVTRMGLKTLDEIEKEKEREEFKDKVTDIMFDSIFRRLEEPKPKKKKFSLWKIFEFLFLLLFSLIILFGFHFNLFKIY